jgi:hypothetical protein
MGRNEPGLDTLRCVLRGSSGQVLWAFGFAGLGIYGHVAAHGLTGSSTVETQRHASKTDSYLPERAALEPGTQGAPHEFGHP